MFGLNYFNVHASVDIILSGPSVRTSNDPFAGSISLLVVKYPHLLAVPAYHTGKEKHHMTLSGDLPTDRHIEPPTTTRCGNSEDI